ncbi:MAG: cytochrome c oxidase subunit II [Proteobacteria bacterium]|nr:cytochrome c oxidase subunit II [Pseudomonadota bacterium]MDA0992380.1 cytochrome c oxidase subunit II [Pseudomonadota bacterium]
MIRKLCTSVLALLIAGDAFADWAVNMPKGVTRLSAETYEIHMVVFWWCVAIAVVVFGAMIWSLINHRKSKGAVPSQFSHSMIAEVIWTTIPVIILLIMAVPSAELMIKLEDTRDPDLTVVITGYQWKWHYAYQGEDVSFYSTLARPSMAARRRNSGIDPSTVENYLLDVDNRLVVPKGAKVRVLLTSNDVIHSWWVPELAMKKDAIPGFMNETWFRAEVSGVYRGQCAELCGMDHGYMPVVVEVVEREAFEVWLENEKGGATPVATASGELK